MKIDHLMKIEFVQALTDNYELPMVALFNETVISEVAVRHWLECSYGTETNSAIVVITKAQYENLFDRTHEDFYDELRIEQQGGII